MCVTRKQRSAGFNEINWEIRNVGYEVEVPERGPQINELQEEEKAGIIRQARYCRKRRRQI